MVYRQAFIPYFLKAEAQEDERIARGVDRISRLLQEIKESLKAVEMMASLNLNEFLSDVKKVYAPVEHSGDR